MKQYTQEEIDKALSEITTLDHRTMCSYWRFAPAGTEIYFRSDLPTGKAFTDRLFVELGGFTSEISKNIGWG